MRQFIRNKQRAAGYADDYAALAGRLGLHASDLLRRGFYRAAGGVARAAWQAAEDSETFSRGVWPQRFRS